MLVCTPSSFAGIQYKWQESPVCDGQYIGIVLLNPNPPAYNTLSTRHLCLRVRLSDTHHFTSPPHFRGFPHPLPPQPPGQHVPWQSFMSQHQQGGIASAPDTRSSDEMSSTNINEKTSDDAEVGLPQQQQQQQQQKPPAGPPGGPPPNGGTTAWLQVLGGFFLFFNTWVCFRCLVACDFVMGWC
jgi:hypothetical protein